MMISIMKAKKGLITKIFSVALALCVWHLASILVDSEILLVSPIRVLKRLWELAFDLEFLSALGFTFKRITLGFFGGFICGSLLALLSGKFKIIEALLWPYMMTIKSVPVASFVVIALIWLTGSNLSVFISFLMVLPIVYTNILEGIKSIDTRLTETADVFKMSFSSRLKYIWLPSLKPFILSAVKLSVGLGWKSGVAAELIGYPEGSIGEALYYSKLYLETADLFAWTVAIVAVSVLFDKLLVFLLKKLLRGEEAL